jgi:gliding motility-associated-like protein
VTFTKQVAWILFGLVIFWLSQNQAVAQGLCDKINRPADAVEGDFMTVGDIYLGCSPLQLKLQDLSGGTDIRYDFYYDRKAAAALDTVGNKDSTNTYFSNNGTKAYTILQYGKKNGKNMYACKTSSVRQAPSVSYTQCNNLVTIFIPNQSLAVNNYIAYKLGTNSEEKLNSNQLPKSSGPKSVNYPISLSSYFVDNTGQKTCEKNQTINEVSNNTAANTPFWGNIKELEMLSPTKVSMEFSGAFDPAGYDIYVHRKYSAYPSTPIKKSIPGKYVFDLPDSTNSYCFFVSRPENCGGTEVSSHLCTIPLQEIIPTPTQNILKWDFPALNLRNTSTPLSPLFGNISVNNFIVIQEKGKPRSIEPVSNTSNTKTYTIDCKKDYCYQLQSTSEGVISNHGFKGVSKSISRCISRKDISTPAITDLMVSVGENQENVVSFRDNSGWSLKKEMYFLFEKPNNPLDSSVGIINFIDKSLQTSNTEKCYFVGYRDQCGSVSKKSPEVCTVQLIALNDQELSWTKAIPFGLETVGNYEIIFYDEDTYMQSLMASFSNSTTQSPLDLKNFKTEAKFKLKIVSSGGKESFSNIIKIPIEPLFFVPDVFTPNGDPDNGTFQIKGRWGRVLDYKLQIYDRWGTELLKIDDFTKNWDGTLHEQALPVGTYLYKLTISLTGNENYIKQGKFELLR